MAGFPAMSDQARLDLLLDGLLHPREVDRLVAGATETPVADFPGLTERTERHLAAVEELAGEDGGVDVDVARRIADALASVLADVPARPDAYSSEARALLRGAVEYFILDKDDDTDSEPGIGFDDDARVLNAVLRAIGRPDLRVAP